MHNGRGMILDFGMNDTLKTFAGKYGDQVQYISGKAKDQLGLSAVMVRPDGIVAWATDVQADCTGLEEAAARWFVH
jgi:hypothetical protein